MDPRLKAELQHLDGVDVRWDAPLAEYTTWRVGGPATCLIRPLHLAGLQRTVQVLNTYSYPYFALGRGSNLLVSDAGVRAAAVSLDLGFSHVERLSPSGALRVGAGVPLKDLLRRCLGWGLGGLEFAAGIPGSVGGAIRMNAGSYGRAMGDVCTAIHVLGEDSSSTRLRREELSFSYRSLELPRRAVIVEADLALAPEAPDRIRAKVRDLLGRRKRSQPWRVPSAGSVFKNPPGDFAGRLVEAAGLKGFRIGDAQIAPEHGNFIVNRGCARARDIVALIQAAREAVLEKFQVALELEIQVLGNDMKV
ncbi:MAG TPA: UDP-N-acetylmuramate dehydrogenase [Syntrophobacteria bacterium]|nr:UDP-N-acetylmuramate dehydrogenase [Syntrophobacteria bacterium]